jgi:hypothetical protein
VASALKKESSARGIEAVFSQLLEDAAFDAYSSRKTKRLILYLNNGRPGYRIELSPILIHTRMTPSRSNENIHEKADDPLSENPKDWQHKRFGKGVIM